jgi:hypothetical protein
MISSCDGIATQLAFKSDSSSKLRPVPVVGVWFEFEVVKRLYSHDVHVLVFDGIEWEASGTERGAGNCVVVTSKVPVVVIFRYESIRRTCFSWYESINKYGWDKIRVGVVGVMVSVVCVGLNGVARVDGAKTAGLWRGDRVRFCPFEPTRIATLSPYDFHTRHLDSKMIYFIFQEKSLKYFVSDFVNVPRFAELKIAIGNWVGVHSGH